MTFARRFATLVAPAALAASLAVSAFAPGVARADDVGHVAKIAAKGSIPQTVPLEGGLALCLGAVVVAVGMQRRSRR
jgi:hypothetical protein